MVQSETNLGKHEVIEYLTDRVNDLLSKLETLDADIKRLTDQRNAMAKARNSYKITLQIESEESSGDRGNS